MREAGRIRMVPLLLAETHLSDQTFLALLDKFTVLAPDGVADDLRVIPVSVMARCNIIHLPITISVTHTRGCF